LGCFIDQIDNRDLEIFINDYEQLTPEQCIFACQQLNYRYAAIQYGSECRCGEEYGKYGQVSDDECDYLCVTSEKCGGENRNSVYNFIESVDLSKTRRYFFAVYEKYKSVFYRFYMFEYCSWLSRLF
jgi:hypothetical protein